MHHHDKLSDKNISNKCLATTLAKRHFSTNKHAHCAQGCEYYPNLGDFHNNCETLNAFNVASRAHNEPDVTFTEV